jgi:hypothetical protein
MAQIDTIQVGSTIYDIAPSADSTNTFTSGDVADESASSWTTVAKLASGETTTSILGKISTMFKNIRYLYSRLGTTDISDTGTTITAAIAALESGKSSTSHTHSAFTSAAAGFVPAAKSGTTSYLTSVYVLTGAGWKAGTKYNTDTNTTYAEYVPTSTASGRSGGLVRTPPQYVESVGRQYLCNDPALLENGNGGFGVVRWQDIDAKKNFTGATTAAAGTAGLVPAPPAGTVGTGGRYLAAGGSWSTPIGTTYANYVGATTAAAGTAGLVPPATTATRTRFLRGDATWQVPANTTYAVMGGATSAAAGTAGLVPAPAAGLTRAFLRGTGTWKTIFSLSGTTLTISDQES